MVGLGGEGGDDFAVLIDDEGGAGEEAVFDADSADVFRAGGRREGGDAVLVSDAAAGIGGDGELAGAVCGVGGALLEAGHAVLGDADDGGFGSGEFALFLGKGVGLQIAAAGAG